MHNVASLAQSRRKESNASGADRSWVESKVKKADNSFSATLSLLFFVPIAANHNT